MDNFGLEATRESMDERFRMLTYASAGAFDVTISIAEAARAERVIRELDPSDIMVLRSVKFGGAPADERTERDVLIGAGCLRMITGPDDGRMLGYFVTSTGELVLQLLRAYEPNSGA